MELLSQVNKTKHKKIYQINQDEFIRGDWLKLIPQSKRIKIEWTSNKGILIIENTPYLNYKEFREGEKNERKS